MAEKENPINLNAWIEINVFGKSVVSEMRGEFEFFYFVEEMTTRERDRYKPRDWAEYNPMKHCLPNNQPRMFHRDPYASRELENKLLEMGHCIVINKLETNRFEVSKLQSAHWLDFVTVDETLELALVKFAKLLFTK